MKHFMLNQSNAIPMMDAGAKAWMFKYAKRNYWRVASWMEFDDLIQDGLYAWCEVCRRYPNAVENPAHIMSLFKLCYADKITDLSRSKTKQQDDARSDIVEVYDGESVVVPDSSTLHALLIKAPEVVKNTIALLTDDSRKDELAKPFARHANGRRETLNERICSMLGLNSKEIDAVRMVKAYLTQTA